MKKIQKISKILLIAIFLIGFVQCKTQDVAQKVPFEITQKTYFYFVGGTKGTNGTTIKIVGTAETRNVTFSTIFFQNHEYKISPEYKGDRFILTGGKTAMSKPNLDLYGNPISEYGNTAPKVEKKIPFDLEKNEAILVYNINGKDFYYKITDIEALDTVIYP